MTFLERITSAAGNLTRNRKYKQSLALLDKYFDQADSSSDRAQFHVAYARNYEKLGNVKKCNYHCEHAVLLRHTGTYAYQRLITNYCRKKRYQDALRLCAAVLDHESIFNKQTWKSINGYAISRKKEILKKINDG